MKKRLDPGTQVVFLSSLIALLIAITGLFNVSRTQKMKDAFFTVARDDIPLSVLTATITTMQRQQADLVGQALASPGLEADKVAIRELRSSFLRTGERLRDAIARGLDTARDLQHTDQPPGTRQKGQWAISILSGISAQYGKYEKQFLDILDEMSSGGQSRPASAAKTMKELARSLEVTTDRLLNEVEAFTEQSANAVVGHSQTMLYFILGFTAVAYMAGVFMLLQIRKIIREKRRAEAQLELLATTDGLSGLFNRRHFLEQLDVLIAAAHRHQLALSLCLCDLDEFKQVNDTYGHAAGDDVIRQFGELVRDEIRVDDLAARYGGDEFCIALIHTPAASACELLERIRTRMERTNFRCENGTAFRATATFGVADMDPAHPDHKVLLESADEALYEAKAKGRNCIVSREREAISNLDD